MAGLLVSSVSLLAPQSTRAAEHTVQPGETLSAIAARYGLPVETLLDVNGLSSPDAIQAGDVLVIPTYAAGEVPESAPGQYHVVADGETLGSLAERYGVAPEALADANGIFDLHSVIAGTTLFIPEPPASSTPEPTETPEDIQASVPAPVDSSIEHRVTAGQYLSLIAAYYGVAMGPIVEANALADPNVIIEGQVLIIPGIPLQGAPASSNTDAETPAGSEASGAIHLVVPGDTLSSIAELYGIALSRLADANNLADNDFITVGERLLIPGATTPSQVTGTAPGATVDVAHVVQMGDTLSGLAARYGVTVEAILGANGLTNPNIVILGSTIDIPGSATGASVPTITAPSVVSGTHVVAAGETLASIALRYGVTEEAIAGVNSIANPNHIVQGSALTIPGAAPGRVYSLDEYAIILENAAAEFGVSAALIKALAWQESGWNQFVVSHASAVGLMQVTPWTGEWALATLVPDATNWQTNPIDNARMGVSILHHWLVRSDWNVETALASYYQGWRALHEIGMYDETRVYIDNVLALVHQFE